MEPVENPPLSEARASMMEETKAQMAALSISLETSQSVLSFVRNLLEQTQEQEKSLRDAVTQMKAREEAGEKIVQERDQTIAELRNKLMSAQERVFLLDKQLEFAIRDRDSRLMDMKSRIDDARGQAEGGSKRAEADLQASEAKCGELEEKMRDMRAQIEMTQKVIIDMQAKSDEQKARADRAEQLLAEAQAAQQESQAAVQAAQQLDQQAKAREEQLNAQVQQICTSLYVYCVHVCLVHGVHT
jgi:chromosome segregation ATPase